MTLQRSILLLTLMVLAPFSLGGCGLLIGNVRPVDEKSDQYGVADLAQENPSVWSRLTDKQEEAESEGKKTAESTQIADVAYQSNKTAAVISLNSSCRPTHEKDADLKALTHQLTYGIGEVSQRIEQNLTIQSTPALQTFLQGKMNGNPISLKAVVFKRDDCVYDLLYMAPPTHFAKNEPDFDHFVASLRLK